MQKDFTQDIHTFTHLVLGSINLTLRLKYQNGVYAAVNLVEPIDNRGPYLVHFPIVQTLHRRQMEIKKKAGRCALSRFMETKER